VTEPRAERVGTSEGFSGCLLRGDSANCYVAVQRLSQPARRVLFPGEVTLRSPLKVN
jgi:hypothetical protein